MDDGGTCKTCNGTLANTQQAHLVVRTPMGIEINFKELSRTHVVINLHGGS